MDDLRVAIRWARGSESCAAVIELEIKCGRFHLCSFLARGEHDGGIGVAADAIFNRRLFHRARAAMLQVTR